MGDVITPTISEDSLGITFSVRHGSDWKYVAAWQTWHHWNGTVWKTEDTNLIHELIRRVCREASDEVEQPGQKRRLASAATVFAVERMLRADRRHAATVKDWDQDFWLLNKSGGTIDLRTGQLKTADRDGMVTKLAGASPGDGCPLWSSFLSIITRGDTELEAYLQRVVGYCLTGSIAEHAVFFLHGHGANGKSVFIRIVSAIMGEYGTTAPTDILVDCWRDRHPTELAGLRGARFVAAVETEPGRSWADSRIKLITGGDQISARFMYRDYFSYLPQFKLMVAGNHKPKLSSLDEAMRRRLHLIPFAATIAKEERDPDLTEKLLLEKDGILSWAIQGCLAWQKIGLSPPAAVIGATDEYFDEEDALARWISDRCTTDPSCVSPVAALYADWSAWAIAASEDQISIRKFSSTLVAKGFARCRQPGTGVRLFQGVAPNSPATALRVEGSVR